MKILNFIARHLLRNSEPALSFLFILILTSIAKDLPYLALLFFSLLAFVIFLSSSIFYGKDEVYVGSFETIAGKRVFCWKDGKKFRTRQVGSLRKLSQKILGAKSFIVPTTEFVNFTTEIKTPNGESVEMVAQVEYKISEEFFDSNETDMREIIVNALKREVATELSHKKIVFAQGEDREFRVNGESLKLLSLGTINWCSLTLYNRTPKNKIVFE